MKEREQDTDRLANRWIHSAIKAKAVGQACMHTTVHA